jgi:hypothetical protein
MFVLLLLFVLPCFQATDLNEFLSSFVANTLPDELRASASDSNLATITPSSDKAAIAATILANLYGLNVEKKMLVPLQSDDAGQVEAALVDGAAVVAVHWGLGDTQSATTYAIVSSAGILESVTKTFTKPEPSAPTSKLHPEQQPPAPTPRYHASFFDAWDVEVAVFYAVVQCTAAPGCAVTPRCVDLRPFCQCQSKSRVECAVGERSKCFAEVAFVGFCGRPTISFDEKTFQYVIDPAEQLVYHNAYVRLERLCPCRPPK